MSTLERAAPGPVALARTAPARVAARAVSGWAWAVSGLVLLIWLIPVQKYTLPVALPFNLEPYRLVIVILCAALVTSVLVGAARFSTAGHGKPVLLFALAALATQVSNWTLISVADAQTPALKSLSYFLSFLIAFVIVCSTMKSVRDVDTVLKASVIGAFVVALAALYEARWRTNLFDNINNYVPFLEEHKRDRTNVRSGRLRVRASAHHPIALAGILVLSVPLAVYLFQQAATAVRKWLWLGVGLVIIAGAFATVSRTVVSMLAAMLLVALILRWRRMLRWWPAVIVLAGFIHYAAPGAITHIYWAFTPNDGLLAQQSGREGMSGSGRIADLGPGFDRFLDKPLVGHGLGIGGVTGETPRGALGGAREGGAKKVIYDNQWLQILISLGVIGFLGALWFVWGAVVKLVLAARRTAGLASDRLTAIAIVCAGFGAGMLTYDTFAFVQVTLFFFVIAALGLRARTLPDE